MTRHGASPPTEPYSPQRRTALLLTGVGTAGAYHAGVLKALHEAGVKLDVAAGSGVGAVSALFAAVDGGSRLWEENGLWRDPAVRGFYAWRPTLRLIVWALAASLAIVVLPILTVAAGLIVFPLDFVLKIFGLGGAGGLVASYVSLAEGAFAPTAFPTWLPRAVFIVLGGTAIALVVASRLNRTTRRRRDPMWWSMARAPLSTFVVVSRCWAVMWDLVRGAAALGQPGPDELARRYVELLSENLGQPGFRELLVSVHDVDARRDLVFALVHPSRRPDLIRRATTPAQQARQAEVFDLAGVAGVHLTDAVAGALAVPLATDYHEIHLSPESFWRGEVHRLCNRPSAVHRLLDELLQLDVTQILLVSAAPETPAPHSLDRLRLDPRGRLGEYLQSSEAGVIREAAALADPARARIFPIQAAHNPIGPFDFTGAHDDRSDRNHSIAELMNRGYEDAYRQFIEPVVGASGDRVGQRKAK